MNKKLIFLLIILAVFSYFLYQFARKGITLFTHPIAGSIIKKQINKPAPSFCISNNKDSICLDTLPVNPVLLVFWAPWCPHCLSELPALNQIHQELSNSVTLISIAVYSKQRMVKSIQEKCNLLFPVFIDANRSVGKKYKIRSLPITYLLDKNRIIRKVFIGENDVTLKNIKNAIKELE